MTTAPVTPSIGSLARTRLAGDAATALGWLRALGTDDGPAEVSAALDALRALRTDLRSLRPILDKAWTVALRDGLDLVTGTLGAVHALDGQIRLLAECGPSGPAADLLDATAAERAALVSTVPAALDPETDAGLAFLASGREPAPLRAKAPVGDPGLPAAVLLPPMLHRRCVVYRDRNNRPKHVRFWHMTSVGPAGTPDPAEVDEVRWVPLAAAAGLLTPRRDRAVVTAFAREHGTGRAA